MKISILCVFFFIKPNFIRIFGIISAIFLFLRVTKSLKKTCHFISSNIFYIQTIKSFEKLGKSLVNYIFIAVKLYLNILNLILRRICACCLRRNEKIIYSSFLTLAHSSWVDKDAQKRQEPLAHATRAGGLSV